MNGVHVLSAAEARTLHALADTFVPGDGDWPSGSTVGVEAHVDELARADKELRSFLHRELRGFDIAAHATTHTDSFADCTADQRETAVKAVETDRPTVVRRLVELVYEAYYKHPAVTKVMARRTGFHFERSMQGVMKSGTDDILTLLAEQAERPRRVRTISDEGDR